MCAVKKQHDACSFLTPWGLPACRKLQNQKVHRLSYSSTQCRFCKSYPLRKDRAWQVLLRSRSLLKRTV